MRPVGVVPAVALAALALACRKVPRESPRPEAPPAVDEAALDRSVSPCEDFYAFACGGWLRATGIPADRASWSRGFAEIQERTLGELRALLEEAAAGKLDPSVRFGDKLGAFWTTCMDEGAAEAGGLGDLRAQWTRIDAIFDRGALVAELARLQAAGIEAPFALASQQDARDAAQVVLGVRQGGLSLPDRDHYVSDAPALAAIREAYRGHLARMLELAGVAGGAAEAQAAQIESFEHVLAQPQWTRTELRDPERVYNRVDRAGLARLAPAFPWGDFFARLGHPELEAVNVTTPRFVEAVGWLLASAPLEDWKAYLRWRVEDRMAQARALPAAIVEERFAFRSRSFTGAKDLEPRWKHCVQMADRALGFALGEAYVRSRLGPEGKDRTAALVAEIEGAMRRDLQAIPWMDAPTRAAALAKLDRIVNKIGYPATGRDYSTMRIGRGSFLRNVEAAEAFELNRQLGKVGKPLDRSEWLMTPPTVNAYYEPQMNEMVFPAGILQPPFFGRTAPDPVNYGGIGMVVGHELTHGFDDEGRRYDAEGDLRDWWTPGSASAFEDRARCVEEQYSAYESVPGVKLNGRLTLGENIADLGGLELAHAAMRKAREARPGAPAVAGLDEEQQFFVGYAQAWCAKYREENLRLRAVTDPHSPARYRVNGPLSNMREFAAAFGCAEGTPMVRPAERRCEVW